MDCDAEENNGGIEMSKFKVGEAVIILGSVYPTSEGEIISEMYEYNGKVGHDVIILDNVCQSADSVSGEWFSPEKMLRKKKPPQETTTWEEMQEITNWNPSKESVK